MKRLTQHSSRLLFALSLLWVSALLLIGAWWVYFMFNFENFLHNTERTKITTMLAWEGGSFIILLLLLSFSLLILYLKDTKKNKSLQAFFASLTHELKTPLASIKLQSEVINEILEQKKDPTLSKLFGRLINDTVKLEIQMDKILQLSRIERGGKLNTTSVALIPLIRKLALPWESQFNVHIETNDKNNLFTIEADEFALELIIKNLFENTKNHTKEKNVTITLKNSEDMITFDYQDEGQFFGDPKKLATLFYKYNSTKGSGIGLYLSKQLVEKMDGTFTTNLNSDHKLLFHFQFKKSVDSHA